MTSVPTCRGFKTPEAVSGLSLGQTNLDFTPGLELSGLMLLPFICSILSPVLLIE